MAAGIGEAGMTLIGAALGLAGKKPVVPPAPHADLGVAQDTSISANIGSMPKLEELASLTDTASVDELLKQLDRFAPGTSANIGKITGIISDQLEGKVPADVLKQIQQGVGSKAWELGLSPSQRTSLSAETIGQTSYSIQQQGVSAAERWMSSIEQAAPRFNFASMFITPAQDLASQQWNEVQRFNTQWLQNKISAMPSPLQQAEMGALQAFGSTVDQYGSMALGAMGGGGGMMGGMGGGGGGGGGGMGSMMSMFGGGGGGGSVDKSTGVNTTDSASVDNYFAQLYGY